MRRFDPGPRLQFLWHFPSEFNCLREITGSPIARPVLVVGVDAPGAGHDKLHDLMVTKDFYDELPKQVREHVICRTVDRLVPVTQKHDIEGLVMG